MATSSDKLGYASEVLMITLCGMIIASGVINMEQYQRVAKVKGEKADEMQKNVDYQSMANTWYGIDTAMGAVLGALILAMMTYQVGKGTPAGKGFTSSQVLTYIFSFFAYAVIVMNSAFGLNVYSKTAAWKPKGECPGSLSTSMRYNAMMAARARAMGEAPPPPAKNDKETAADAAKYASDVNKTNIAFITISTIFFAVFITYLGYNEAKKRGIAGGMRSQFLVY